MSSGNSQHSATVGGSASRNDPDPYLWGAISMTAVLMLTLPAILGVIVLLQPGTGEYRAAQASITHAGISGQGGSRISPASLGESTYASSCAVCHGPTGAGVHSLGKPLRNSAFVQDQTDEQLFAVIVDGRKPSDPSNTTGALMPARGAQSLGDDAVNAVIGYLRSMQDPDVEPVSTEPWNIVGRESGATTAIELTDHAGYDLFVSSCAACHGQGGEGIEGLGLPMTTSGFIRGTSDPDLVRFIKSGRASWDTNNSTGLDMPPKGGNPAITDAQLQQIVEYIRAIQNEAVGP